MTLWAAKGSVGTESAAVGSSAFGLSAQVVKLGGAMKIAAWVKNAGNSHELEVSTNGTARTFAIPAKAAAGGSAVNGGELLMLALATCFCNDLYREAARLGIAIAGVEVQASAEFDGIGLAASNVSYRARVQSNEPGHRIEQLLRETDAVAEVHNTIRNSVQVRLLPWR